MFELRRRKMAADRATERLMMQDELRKNARVGATPPQRPRQSTDFVSLRARVQAVVSAVVIAAVFILWKSPKSTLPTTYALCSKSRQIYTVEPDQATVECVVVDGAYIADLGSRADITERWGDKYKTGPVAGSPQSVAKAGLIFKTLPPRQAVVPGLSDSHAHVLDYGKTMQLPLAGSRSVEEVVKRTREYIQRHPDVLNDTSVWIQGGGWDQTLWESGEFPTWRDLDADPVLKGRPIVLDRVDVHASWVSSRVLEILSPLPDVVDGGHIIRDVNGEPTGVFVDNARQLVSARRPPDTDAQLFAYYKTAMRDALEHGLTHIQDAAAYPNYADFFVKMADKGMLPMRLTLMAHIDGDDYWGGNFTKLFGYADNRLNMRSVKLFMDGALGSWGAAMIEPYSDKPNEHGLLLSQPHAMSKLIHQFIEDDWQVNVHCIGDRANHIVLDAFESALSGHEHEDRRPRIEHAQILTQEDIKRFGKLGVIASVQPTHATSDMGYAELRLGPERIKGAYAWRSLIDTGAQLALGSDFPVEGINPLLGFYAAVTRLRPDGSSPHGPGGWYMEQALTRPEALYGMTLGAAYAAFQEEQLGSLKVGKRADLVVLDQDIMKVPQEKLLQTKVKATIVDGKIVYGKV
ncbi:hypothetical protein CALVIDRAFT_505253 [Calocera viscosa TUFC12733]|uniref:Amidohydrolase 3 domain-containing protein n=1 Tax=Calocera viscosa (strain TUFC12733) TaxID=1330018 RepID=A0A167HM00_CALVF|nr:hypothetical protein CALVIDRAFT_505253 [Calocera viscosa TUFC12733]